MSAISIIVTIYNVEKWFPRCVESISAQTFTDFECILVDDGSPDSSGALCDEYVLKDSRFSVIHQENRGLPQARHVGVLQAKSPFLMFVDSDDWLPLDALQVLYEKQQSTNAKIVIGGYQSAYPRGLHGFLHRPLPTSGSVWEYYFYGNVTSLWGKLYKTELFSDCFIPVANIGEDLIVTFQVFSKVSLSDIQIVDTFVYYYDRRTNGMVLQTRCSDYASYLDSPHISTRLWIGENIARNGATEAEKNAFLYFLLRHALIPYLKLNKTITRSDVEIIYNEYYLPCTQKKRIPYKKRMIIPLFHFSIPLAKVYRYI